jgi:hypothetical protein
MELRSLRCALKDSEHHCKVLPAGRVSAFASIFPSRLERWHQSHCRRGHLHHGAGTDLFLYSLRHRVPPMALRGCFSLRSNPGPRLLLQLFNSLGCFGFRQILVESSPASSESVLRYNVGHPSSFIAGSPFIWVLHHV